MTPRQSAGGAVRRLALVVNPAAGGGRAGRALPGVVAALRAGGHDVVSWPTRDLEHAEKLAAAATRDGRVAVAFGGDGLAGRVAGAVAAAGGCLGVLPGGRGNDFARALGLPGEPRAACRVLGDGVPVRLDLGEVDGRAFLGIASVGFDSVVQEIANTTRLPLGRLVYLYGAVRGAITWRPATYRLELDGRGETVVGWSVAVANSPVYGGGMRLAPDASLSDGLLDVVITTRTGRLTLFRVLPKIFRGSHVAEPSVRIERATVVRISADRVFRVFADGEPAAALPCEIRVAARAVETLVPARRR